MMRKKKYKFLRYLISTIKGILKLSIAIVKNSAISLDKNIERAGKLMLWGLVIVVLIIMFGNLSILLYKNPTVIEQITIPNELRSRGVNAAMLTKTIIGNANKMVQEQVFYNRTAGEKMETSSDNWRLSIQYDGKTYACDRTIFPVPQIRNMNATIGAEVLSDSPKDINIVLPDIGISLSNALTSIRNLVEPDYTRLLIGITEENKRYTLTVQAQYGSNFVNESQYTSMNFNDIEKHAALLVILYTNPHIYSAMLLGTNIKKAVTGEYIARKYLPRYDTSWLNALVGYGLMMSADESEIADATRKYDAALGYFDRAVNKDDSNIYARLGRLKALAEIYSKEKMLTSYGDGIDSYYLRRMKAEFFRRTHEIDKATLKDVAFKAYMADIYSNMGEEAKARSLWEEVIDTIFGGNFQEFLRVDNIFYSYIDYLIIHKRADQAKTIFIEFEKRFAKVKGFSDYLKQNPKAVIAKRLVMLTIGKSLSFSKGMDERYFGPCDYLTVAEYYAFNGHLLRIFRNSKEGKKYSRMANLYFRRSYDAGMSGFNFYNDWAGTLGDLGRYDDAIKKYKTANEYSGTNMWVYSNIGWILFNEGRYKEANQAFKRSLEIGRFLAAEDGYLRTLLLTGQFDEFADEYSDYRDMFAGKEEQQRVYDRALKSYEEKANDKLRK